MFLFLGLLPGGAQTPPDAERAQEEREFLEVLSTPISSASKREQSLLESPQAAEVLTREQIRAMGVFDLLVALRTLTSVDTQDTSAISTVVLRGMAPPGRGFPRIVQTLVDGVPLYNSEVFPVFWNALPVPLDAIEKVEVVRGPSSTLYGANAQVGVVAITTRGAGPGLSGSLRAGGGEGHARGQAFVGFGKGGFSLTAAAAGFSRTDRGGEQRVLGTGRMDPQTEASHGSQALLRPQLRLGGATLWAEYGRGELGGLAERVENPATGLVLARISSQGPRAEILQGGWRQAWSPTLHTELRVQESRIAFHYGAWSPGTPGNPQATLVFNLLMQTDPRLREGYDAQAFRAREVTAQVNWDPSPTAHLILGADARELQADASGILGFATRQEASGSGAFLSAEGRWGPLQVSGGLRAENESLGGARTSPRLSIAYALGPGSSLRAGYFTSTRSPQMAEKSATVVLPNQAIIPNPGIRPEKATSWEVGFRKAMGRWALDATVYRMKLERASALVPTGATTNLGPLAVPVNQFRNGAELTNRGLELTLRGELRPGWILGLNATYVDYEDPATGTQADNAPKILSNLWTRLESGRWFAYGGLRFKGAYGVEAAVGPATYAERLPGRLQADVHAGAELGRGFNLSAYAFNAARERTGTKTGGIQNVANVHTLRREVGIQGSWRF